ncbi:putative regulatory protein RecX [Thiobacillus denitrificans ATCC 25259]|uniref:Regulatory protein RecX n=1 Tax=Thiobacillus denitrificans (strain ATCC 25259 / T1) TaxID=292415 RepID=Q3SGU2_THIDA|nr:recombination regulator RecX [Thiobacillus denitrificans]AAZ98151.1 putative regulatory protein RecX [Thiobacillus denitrificans ATCC 25259]
MKTKSRPEPSELRERALRYLARREHSRWELARKLEQAGFVIEEIAPLLDEFEEKNWLSDRRFAESWVADHQAKAGSMKLAYELRQRGVAEELIATVLADTADNELERARAVWRRKYAGAPADAAEKMKQMRFLQSRGFTLDVVRQIVDSAKVI